MKHRPAILTLSFEDIKKISVYDFPGNADDLNPAELRHIFEKCDALWLHSGDPKAPHAELTSGKCSNGFVDVLRVLRYTNLCQIFSKMLVRKLEGEYDYYSKHEGGIDWVVGSDHAGATISYAVGSWFGAQHDFTEKGPDKTQVWKRFAIQPDEIVLQVEELVTITGTLKAVRDAINIANPTPVNFAPVVMTLVHRSDQYEFEGGPILYLAHFDIQTWQPKDCPLCLAGSERIRPKQNWEKLTGK
jgi:orotate phosphoribosyltransferase